MTIKDIKKGTYFTLIEENEPKERQVWIKGDYDRSSKTYSCISFADMNKERFFKASKPIYTDFTF